MEILYIYKEPFQGSIENTMTKGGTVHYTGEAVTRKYTAENGSLISETKYINGLTFEQYNEQKGGNLKLATSEEIDILFQTHTESLISDFEEVTEESFYDGLECLPPCRWHTHKGVEMFYISEAYTDNLHTFYAQLNGKYYSATRRNNEPSESLAEAVNKAQNLSTTTKTEL
jgi:hypothetical protein